VGWHAISLGSHQLSWKSANWGKTLTCRGIYTQKAWRCHKPISSSGELASISMRVDWKALHKVNQL
jgi:hypothetical protein